VGARNVGECRGKEDCAVGVAPGVDEGAAGEGFADALGTAPPSA
jgi:hypothetical protein